jgi:hypothetical protein
MASRSSGTKVIAITYGDALCAIVIMAKTAHGNRVNARIEPGAAEQLPAIAIGEADVADQHMALRGREGAEGRIHRRGGNDLMSHLDEVIRQSQECVLVIFNDKNPQWAAGSAHEL